MSGYHIYRDKDSRPAQHEFIESVPTSDVANRDAEYIRQRLPKEDRVWHQWESQPQNVPLFDLGQLREAVNEPPKEGA